jgi:hypothetical protein
MIYRRPPARPVAAEPGGSWFSGGTEEPATDGQRTEQPAEVPVAGRSPGSSSRVSFGFSGGPISPNRQVAEPVPPVRRPSGAEPAVRRPTGAQPALPAGAENGGRQVFTEEFEALRPGRRTSTDEFAALRPPKRDDTGEFPRPEERVDGRGDTGEFARVNRRDTSGDLAERARGITTDEFAALRPANHGGTDEFAPPQPGNRGEGDQFAVRGEAGLRSGDDQGVPGGERLPAVPQEEPPRRSKLFTVGVVLLSAVVLLAGSVVGVAYFSGSDNKLDDVLQLGAGDAAKSTVTAPLDNRTKAGFELLAGANVVHLSIGELGDDLYRISTPDDAGIRPSPEIRNDDVKLQVTKDGDGTGGELDVVLAAKVHWSLRFSGYAEKQVLDLTGGQVTGIEMVAGTRKAEIVLSQPSGTVPVKINGAVDELILKSPSDSPVRIRVDGGAKTVVAGSRTLKDVTAGSTLTPKNWATQNRYDVAAGARITSLTVENA